MKKRKIILTVLIFFSSFSIYGQGKGQGVVPDIKVTEKKSITSESTKQQYPSFLFGINGGYSRTMLTLPEKVTSQSPELSAINLNGNGYYAGISFMKSLLYKSSHYVAADLVYLYGNPVYDIDIIDMNYAKKYLNAPKYDSSLLNYGVQSRIRTLKLNLFYSYAVFPGLSVQIGPGISYIMKNTLMSYLYINNFSSQTNFRSTDENLRIENSGRKAILFDREMKNSAKIEYDLLLKFVLSLDLSDNFYIQPTCTFDIGLSSLSKDNMSRPFYLNFGIQFLLATGE